MGRLLRDWLRLLEDEEAHRRVKVWREVSEGKTPGWFSHPESISRGVDNHLKKYKEGGDPIELMRAFNMLIQHRFPLPAWAIEGLDKDSVIEGLDKVFDTYRPFPKKTGIKWLTHREVMNQWGIDQDQDCNLKLARHIWNDGLPYYIVEGKWLPEEAQAIRKYGVIIYQGRTWIDKKEITLDRIVKNLSDLVFSVEDVTEFETEHSELFKKLSSPITKPETIAECEQFVKSLRVSYESPLEIKIQRSGKPAKVVDCKSLGFRNEDTREWKDLLQILQGEDHYYNAGPAHTKGYDQAQKVLKEINSKLVKSFSYHFGVQFLKDFHLYELDHSEKPGTYRFKFQIINKIADSFENTYNRYSDEQLLSKMKSLREKNKKQSLKEIERDKALTLLTIIHKRGLMEKSQIEMIFKEFNKLSKIEEIEKEFHELKESSEALAIKDYDRYEAHKDTDID